MPWPVYPTGFFGVSGDSDSYKIKRSLRFNSSDLSYLSRTFGSPTTQNVFTFSAWCKRCDLGRQQIIFGTSAGGNLLQFESSDSIILTIAGVVELRTTAKYRDTSAWYHIVWSQNGSIHTVYVNGVTESTANAVSSTFNTSVLHLIGGTGSASHLSGYLTEIYFIDGSSLTPSSFAETDPITGRWKAKKYKGVSYGNNGFYLNFSDNSGTTSTTLGKDYSGNTNNWTPSGFSVDAGVNNDSLVDTPTNYGSNSEVGGDVRGNYATLNPLSGNSTPVDGNLRPNDDGTAISTIGMSSGKWYAEMTVVAVGTLSDFGVHTGSTFSSYVGSTATGYSYSSDGKKYNNGSGSSYGSTYTTGDVIGCAFNADSGELTFYKNGVSQGVAFTGLTSVPYFFGIYGRSSATANNVYVNFGQRPFSYTVPTGFKCLCTQVLPTPIIQKPGNYMDVVAYTGTGASNSISGFNFSPDFVWLKNRGTSTSHAIYDTSRGVQKQLSCDTTGDEVTSSTGLTSFNSNGFTIGTSSLVNTSGTQYVAWAWDESNISGLDIISYTGNGANRTINHNLGVAPKMIIIKARTTAGADQAWPVYHASLSNTEYLLLDSTNTKATGADYWNSTSPTSSVFSLGTNAAVNANNDTYIAYAFSEVDGFSKIGSYVGNGNSNGVFVWCGFRPKYFLFKRIASTYSFGIIDYARSPSNPATKSLSAANANSEATIGNIDFVSNGIKFRTISDPNASATYVFAAFAEYPFKYARAR